MISVIAPEEKFMKNEKDLKVTSFFSRVGSDIVDNRKCCSTKFNFHHSLTSKFNPPNDMRKSENLMQDILKSNPKNLFY